MNLKIKIIILIALAVGFTTGYFIVPRQQEWEKQDIEEYRGYCEGFKGGEFYRLNGYPAYSTPLKECSIYIEIEKCKKLGGKFWYYDGEDGKWGKDKLYCDIKERIELNALQELK